MAKASTPTLMPVPEGVAAPDARVLYVPAPVGGLAAVEAATGEAIWQRDDAHLALLAQAGRVLALVGGDDGRLRPAWLSAVSGEPFGTPGAALPGLAGLPGAWAITATQWADERLLLAWSVRAGFARGVLAFDTGRLQREAEATLWPAPPPWPGAGDEAVFADSGAVLPPWTVQGEPVALAVRTAASSAGEEPAQRSLVLARAGGHEAAVLVETLPPPGYLQALASPDPSLVTLMHTVHEAGNGTPAGLSRWLLFSAPEGRALASLAAEDGLQPPFFRAGSLVLACQWGRMPNKRTRPPRWLRAWQAGSGLPLWQRPLPPHSPWRLD